MTIASSRSSFLPYTMCPSASAISSSHLSVATYPFPSFSGKRAAAAGFSFSLSFVSGLRLSQQCAVIREARWGCCWDRSNMTHLQFRRSRPRPLRSMHEHHDDHNRRTRRQSFYSRRKVGFLRLRTNKRQLRNVFAVFGTTERLSHLKVGMTDGGRHNRSPQAPSNEQNDPYTVNRGTQGRISAVSSSVDFEPSFNFEPSDPSWIDWIGSPWDDGPVGAIQACDYDLCLGMVLLKHIAGEQGELEHSWHSQLRPFRGTGVMRLQRRENQIKKAAACRKSLGHYSLAATTLCSLAKNQS